MPSKLLPRRGPGHPPADRFASSAGRIRRSRRPVADWRSEAAPAQLLGIALPLARNLHVEGEVDLLADERLDGAAGACADLLEPLAAAADYDALLAVALDPEVRVHLEQFLVVAV